MNRPVARHAFLPNTATTEDALDDHRILDQLRHKNVFYYTKNDRKHYRKAVRHTRRTGKLALRAAVAMGVDV